MACRMAHNSTESCDNEAKAAPDEVVRPRPYLVVGRLLALLKLSGRHVAHDHALHE